MSLSYVHRYHAGHFADIHKHLALIAILMHLQKKTTPICVLDAFAGEGLYNLDSPESQKTGEYQTGLSYILKDTHPTPLLQAFLQMIQSIPQRHYPGSPAIIQHFLRDTDRAHFIERHPRAYSVLKSYFGDDSRLSIHDRDAFEALKALVPFKEKRGLVFIDPSYEIKTEYEKVIATLATAYAKFSTGTYLLWYPILYNENYHEVLLKHLKMVNLEKVWIHEWVPFKQKKEERGIYGSGLVILNPPWEVDKIIQQTFRRLNETLYSEGKEKGTWIIPLSF